MRLVFLAQPKESNLGGDEKVAKNLDDLMAAKYEYNPDRVVLLRQG
jgi:hypothetical protein